MFNIHPMNVPYLNDILYLEGPIAIIIFTTLFFISARNQTERFGLSIKLPEDMNRLLLNKVADYILEKESEHCGSYFASKELSKEYIQKLKKYRIKKKIDILHKFI